MLLSYQGTKYWYLLWFLRKWGAGEQRCNAWRKSYRIKIKIHLQAVLVLVHINSKIKIHLVIHSPNRQLLIVIDMRTTPAKKYIKMAVTLMIALPRNCGFAQQAPGDV